MEQEKKQEKIVCRSIPVKKVIQELDEYFEKNQLKEAGVHLRRWLEEAKSLGDWRGELAVQNELMGYYRNTLEEEPGLLAVREGLNLIQTHHIEDTVTGATSMINAATTLKAFGRAGEGIKYYEAAFHIFEKKLDKQDYRFAGLYNNMALAWTDLGEYEKAKQYFHMAMEITSKLPGGMMETAMTWVNLACLYEKWRLSQEDMDEKISFCMENAWLQLEDPGAARDGYYGFTCMKCADSFGHFGYFLRKKELEKRAADIYERA